MIPLSYEPLRPMGQAHRGVKKVRRPPSPSGRAESKKTLRTNAPELRPYTIYQPFPVTRKLQCQLQLINQPLWIDAFLSGSQ